MLTTDVLFVTSGLGHAMGGIGTASEHMVRALRPHVRVSVAVSPPERSRIARGLRLSARLLAANLQRPRLVFYEHRGLASLHPLVPWLRGVPYAVFLHGYEIWSPLTRWQRRTLEGATCLVANSRTTIDEARRSNPWLPEARVVHLGVVLPEPFPPERPTEPLLVLVARMADEERYKGHDEVLDAWPEIRAAVPDARFVAIGTGNGMARLQARAAREGARGVEFTGLIPDQAKNDWLRRARAALAVGRAEGFGLANVEAAGLGIPLIGLAGTVLEELFPPGVGVRLLPSLDRAQLAAAAIDLLTDPAGAAAMGERGRQHVLARYTFERFAERFCSVLLPFVEPRGMRRR